MKFSRSCSWALLLFAACGIAGCSKNAQSNGGPDAAIQMHGKAIYQIQCSMCHDATDLHLIKEPPRLDGVFRKSALPSGAPANDTEVRNVILHGRGIMPPFEQSVSVADVDAIIAYLHTR